MTIQTTNADMYPQGTVDMSYREGYLKALEDAMSVIDEEYARWMDDDEEEYPKFGNIHTGLEHLKSAYEKEQGDGN